VDTQVVVLHLRRCQTVITHVQIPTGDGAQYCSFLGLACQLLGMQEAPANSKQSGEVWLHASPACHHMQRHDRAFV